MTSLVEAPLAPAQPNALIAAMLARQDDNTATAALHVLDADGAWRTRSWADLLETSESVAARLESNQDTAIATPVAIIGEPTIETVAVLLGAWMAGRASTIVPGPNRFAKLETWAEDTTTRLSALGVRDAFGRGTAARALTANLDGESTLRLTDLDSVASWPAAPASFTVARRPIDETAVVQGTAGSTGVPKFVRLNAIAVRHNVEAVLARTAFGPGDALCSWLPLYHDMGLIMLLAGMVSGNATWLAPTSAFAKSPADWLGWLEHSGATITSAPNFAYALLGRYARLVKNANLGGVRLAICGGEPIDVDAMELFSAELGKYGFDPRALACSYGLAEAMCALTMPRASAGVGVDEVHTSGGVHRAALLGAPVDGVELRIAPSEHRTDFDEVRDVGEIEFRSAAQMMGYAGEPPVGADTWIGTGDLGYLSDGQLVVCGRSKELITVGGRNVFPQEVERVAAGVPGVRPGGTAAVGGRSGGTRRDQLVVVAEYVGDDPDGARNAIIDEVTSRCGISPGTVDFVPVGSLPKTTSGKLRRADIAAGYR